MSSQYHHRAYHTINQSIDSIRQQASNLTRLRVLVLVLGERGGREAKSESSERAKTPKNHARACYCVDWFCFSLSISLFVCCLYHTHTRSIDISLGLSSNSLARSLAHSTKMPRKKKVTMEVDYSSTLETELPRCRDVALKVRRHDMIR